MRLTQLFGCGWWRRSMKASPRRPITGLITRAASLGVSSTAGQRPRRRPKNRRKSLLAPLTRSAYGSFLRFCVRSRLIGKGGSGSSSVLRSAIEADPGSDHPVAKRGEALPPPRLFPEKGKSICLRNFGNSLMVFPWIGNWRWPSETGRRASFETVASEPPCEARGDGCAASGSRGAFLRESTRKSLKIPESWSLNATKRN